MMNIRIRFVGGPINDMAAFTDGLDELKIFFQERDKQVLAYRRTDELVYVYDATLTKQLSEQYDAAYARFSQNSSSIMSWDIPHETPE